MSPVPLCVYSKEITLLVHACYEGKKHCVVALPAYRLICMLIQCFQKILGRWTGRCFLYWKRR